MRITAHQPVWRSLPARASQSNPAPACAVAGQVVHLRFAEGKRFFQLIARERLLLSCACSSSRRIRARFLPRYQHARRYPAIHVADR